MSSTLASGERSSIPAIQESPPPGSSVPLVWGLDARGLHDAWWRGQGVQCVRRGQSFEANPGVELFMLLESRQLVTFDLTEVADAMIWSSTRVRRIRIVERSEESFKEQIVRGEDGVITGIRRSYSHDHRVGHKIFLTDDATVAAEWASAPDGNRSWRVLRNAAGRSIGQDRAIGLCHDADLADDRVAFIQRLVATWNDPFRVIEGIEEVSPGIVGVRGQVMARGEICLPPVWLGACSGQDAGRVLVGPDFKEDSEAAGATDGMDVRVLDIRDILQPNGRRSSGLVPRGSVYGLAKRIFDVTAAVAVLVLLAPVFLVVGLIVGLDDGLPLFFGHTRQKRGGAPFKCWKFRTMRRDAESLVADLQSKNKADGPQVFIENDPRVTRIGRFLRKFQLDELPQFWNVLVGDMSVVGPRPSPDKENQFCPAWREMRLSVRPGITGLWQVERTRAPGEDFQEWIKYDLEYVRTASFMLDLRICLKTAKNLIF